MKKTERSRPALLAVSLGGSILAVILALLLVNVIRGGRQASGSGGEDTPYPYRWAEKRDGTLSVTLSAPPEGYAWSADFGADAETVAAEQTKPGAFILAPLRENPATVTFTLAHEDDAADRLAALELGVSVETRGNRLKVTAALDELTVLPGMLRGGDELGCPYRIWNEGPRLIVFLTDGAKDPDWAVHIADRRVAAASWQETADGGWRAAFLAGETGETTLTLLSGASKKEGIDFSKSKGVAAMAVSILAGVASALYDKKVVASMDPLFLQSWCNFYITVLLALCILVKSLRDKENRERFKWDWMLVVIAVFITGADMLYFFALKQDGALLSVISLMRRCSVVVTFVVGAIVFKEKNLKAKSLDLAILLAGIFCLVLGSQ